MFFYGHHTKAASREVVIIQAEATTVKSKLTVRHKLYRQSSNLSAHALTIDQPKKR